MTNEPLHSPESGPISRPQSRSVVIGGRMAGKLVGGSLGEVLYHRKSKSSVSTALRQTQAGVSSVEPASTTTLSVGGTHGVSISRSRLKQVAPRRVQVENLIGGFAGATMHMLSLCDRHQMVQVKY
jgi:hypothetical protein